MVMEASPSPQSVGREFVRQYYTLLNKAPAHLHRFYNNYSSFVHGGLDAPNRETLPVIGQKQIHNRIQQLNFRDCHAKISQVDSQATLGSGVVVQVTGELSNAGAPMRRFTQTFVLAAQSPKKYYVHNDIFRYQDIVFSDEEGEGEGEGDARSSGSEEEARGYFPPPAFPPPPPAPAPAQVSAPPALDQPLNGHPALHQDFINALNSVSLSEAAPEPAPAPAPAAPPAPLAASPPLVAAPAAAPCPAEPPAPPEPKTYANLLKSAVAPPAPAAPAPAATHAAAPPPLLQPASVPLEPRPRPPRAPRDFPPANESPAGAGPAPPSVSRPRYPDCQQLFLGGVPAGASEASLRALLAKYGPVAELRVHGRAPSSRQPLYGFVTYETRQAALDCLQAAPLPFGSGADAVKLNVEEKKARGGREPRRRPPSASRPAPPRPYRR